MGPETYPFTVVIWSIHDYEGPTWYGITDPWGEVYTWNCLRGWLFFNGRCIGKYAIDGSHGFWYDMMIRVHDRIWHKIFSQDDFFSIVDYLQRWCFFTLIFWENSALFKGFSHASTSESFRPKLGSFSPPKALPWSWLSPEESHRRRQKLQGVAAIVSRREAIGPWANFNH